MRNAARQTAPQPITVLFSWKVRRGQEAAFMDWLHGITKAALRWPGHMGVTTLRPPGSNIYHSVLHFDTDDHLRAWLDSSERHKWLEQLKGIAVVAGSTKATGLETWFDIPGTTVTPPPKWKMVVVTFVAVYPLSLLLGAFVSPHILRWNIFIRALLFPVIAPIVLTYSALPFLTQRVFKRWLYKAPRSES